MPEIEFLSVVNFDKAVELEQSYDLYIAPEHFIRLKDACVTIDAPVHAVYRFYRDLQGLRTIEGSIECPKVIFRCERCGKDFSRPLKAKFKSTCDEEKAKSLKLEDKLDLIEVQPSGDFEVLNYLEDCLLLEVPYAPRHEENSPECVPQTDWSYGELAPEATQNPFAVLSELKNSLKK